MIFFILLIDRHNIGQFPLRWYAAFLQRPVEQLA